MRLKKLHEFICADVKREFVNHLVWVSKARVFRRGNRTQPGQVILQSGLQVERHCFQQTISRLLYRLTLRGYVQVQAESGVARFFPKDDTTEHKSVFVHMPHLVHKTPL
jgi:hypothetical protein